MYRCGRFNEDRAIGTIDGSSRAILLSSRRGVREAITSSTFPER